MADGIGLQQGVSSAAAPTFVTDEMRSSHCSIAASQPHAQGLELLFGAPEAPAAGAGRLVPRLTHRLLLDRTAATHLEEALTRVLGVPADAGRRNGPQG